MRGAYVLIIPNNAIEQSSFHIPYFCNRSLSIELIPCNINLTPRAFITAEKTEGTEGRGKLWSHVVRNMAFFPT